MQEQSTHHKLFFQLLWISLFLFLPTSLSTSSWAEDTLDKMSLKEKVSQLVMAKIYTLENHPSLQETLTLLKEYPIGGVLFMQGTIKGQQRAYKLLQSRASIPILTAQDNEWGLSMRLENSMRFPRNLMLGALQNEALIFELGKEIGNQCKAVGVHVNFAPVVDINNNPKNPVINDRSFGENPELVTKKALLWMKGFQSTGLIACAKHFPGHGNTELDSHFSLPVIHKSIEDLKQLEWRPFNALIDQGVSSIMVGHLHLPLISELPTSLCYTSISTILKKELGFKGLIFTDAMEMKAILGKYTEGDTAVLAIKAGNDIIVGPQNIKATIDAIYSATLNNEISQNDIDQHVLKILKTKEKLGLHQNSSLPNFDLFSAKAKKLKEKLFKEAITLASSEIKPTLSSNKKTAFVQIGRDVIMKDALELIYSPYEEQCPKKPPVFFDSLSKEIHGDYFFIPKISTENFISDCFEKLRTYDQIVIGIFEMNKFSTKNFGITPSTLSLLKILNPQKITLCLFGSPYSLKFFKNQKAILMAYENDEDAQIGCSEILLGKRIPKGVLPVTIEPFTHN